MRTASCRRGASTRRGAPSPASGTRRSRARSTCRSGRRRCRRPAAPKRRAGCAAAAGAADRPAGLARALTHAPCCARAVSRAKIRRKHRSGDPAQGTRRRVPRGEARLREDPRKRRASVFVAPATFQVPHLVQPAFLLLGFASHPLALLDELADLLPALVTDLLVERRAILVPDGLTALSPPELTTLAADLLVELDAPLVADALAALAAGFGDRHAALSVAAGLDHLEFLSRSHSCAGSGTTSPPGAGVLSSEDDLAVSIAAFLPSSISVRTRCPPFLPISS